MLVRVRQCEWPDPDELPGACFASCRYALPVSPWCALTVASSGRQTIERVAELLELSEKGIRKIERRALRKFTKRFRRVVAAMREGGSDD